MAGYFTPRVFAFLRDLKAHNDREWFAAHKPAYLADVEAPMLALITDMAPRLRTISPAFVVDRRRSGGSMYRIYRDTRFSADKSPYKSWLAAGFSHEAGKTEPHVPGFYLHLEPRDSMGGGGVYHPDTATLTRIRERMVKMPKAWDVVRRSGVVIEGDRLTRVPAGFDPAHRFVEDLKWKDLYTMAPFTARQVCGPDFPDRLLDACERAAPLVEFVTRALGLRW